MPPQQLSTNEISADEESDANAKAEAEVNWTTDHEYVGKRVLRAFDGVYADGTVTKYLRSVFEEPALWHILYDDSDEEDMDHEEVEAALAAAKAAAAEVMAAAEALTKARAVKQAAREAKAEEQKAAKAKAKAEAAEAKKAAEAAVVALFHGSSADFLSAF